MDYETLASPESIERVRSAVALGNVETQVLESGADALAKLKELIPPGASLMNASSTTLDQIGFVDYLKSGTHGWNNIHEAILKETDPMKQSELRGQSAICDVFVGSVHAIAETGEIVTASATGSQIGPYAFGPKTIIWVASTKKIVSDLNGALARIREYDVPKEDARMKAAGYPGTTLAKMLIFMKETDAARKVILLLVNEPLGY